MEESLTLSTLQLLQPELMSTDLLRAILQERGAAITMAHNREYLVQLYDKLVLPKPKRLLNPHKRTTQKILEQLGGCCNLESLQPASNNQPQPKESQSNFLGSSLLGSQVHVISTSIPVSLKRRVAIDEVEVVPSKRINVITWP